MKKSIILPGCFLFILSCLSVRGYTQAPARDTVKVGIYIASIHDVDFKEKEYSVNLWLWLRYKNKDLDFYNNLEIPQAKTFTKSFLQEDSSANGIYMQMKLQCVMKESWKTGNFPFDKQRLRIAFENAKFDSSQMIFVADTVGEHYDKRFVLNGWTIDSCLMNTGIKRYETNFGVEDGKRYSDYASFRVRLVIRRDAMGLFWKVFLGMYIAFLIAYVCFYIHADSIDSRFGLSVGSLFAVVGNKYIIDSSLPESTSFTLVDNLHGLTLFFIFCVITSTAYSLWLVKNNQYKKSYKFDMIVANVLLLIYVVLNIYFISNANAW